MLLALTMTRSFSVSAQTVPPTVSKPSASRRNDHPLPGTSQNPRHITGLVAVLHVGHSQRSVRIPVAACREAHSPQCQPHHGFGRDGVRSVSFTTRLSSCSPLKRTRNSCPLRQRTWNSAVFQSSRRQPRTTYPRNQAQRTRRLPPADRAWRHSERYHDQADLQ